ncbi:MAG: YIP1 family protein [Thermoanaerobaculia bacterium]|nr:MAG: YIP1 family protein [Thermoanaerobaculia bacterium]
MSDPEARAPETGEGATSALVMGRALASPEAAFRAIAARPLFALALVLLVVAGVIAVGVGFSKVTAEDYLRAVEEGGREMPPQFREEPERLMSIARWGAVVSAALVPTLLYFALAGIFLVVFRLLGSEIDYRRSLSVTVHGLLPLGVAALVGVVIALARETVSVEELQGGGLVMSNLGFLAGEETSKPVRALLTSVDLFSAWAIGLLALGYRIVARVSPGAAWGAVAVIWALGVAVKVGLAAAF